MKKLSLVLMVVMAIGFASVVQAQATRTWVSGVGDDVNPCSRTAPCKTFAGAISKTATGGIINCLDPGGFGAVTIIKSIELDCTGTLGSILSSGSPNAVVVNATNTSRVVLRDISINGTGTTLGTNGVNIIQALNVHVLNCSIASLSGSGITTTNGSTQVGVYVDDTEILATGNGILAASTGTGTTLLTVSDSQITNNAKGIEVASGNSAAHVSNTVLSRNTTDGFKITPGTSGGALESCNISFNGNGVNVATAGGEARLSRNTILSNFTNGVTGLGTTRCFGNNTIAGNIGNQTCTVANNAQQ